MSGAEPALILSSLVSVGSQSQVLSLPCPALPCPALPYPTLPYPALPCIVLFCSLEGAMFYPSCTALHFAILSALLCTSHMHLMNYPVPSIQWIPLTASLLPCIAPILSLLPTLLPVTSSLPLSTSSHSYHLPPLQRRPRCVQDKGHHPRGHGCVSKISSAAFRSIPHYRQIYRGQAVEKIEEGRGESLWMACLSLCRTMFSRRISLFSFF